MKYLKYLLILGTLSVATGLMMSCGGGLDPTLGAALIFEEQITDNIKAQIVLRDGDLFGEDDDQYGY